MLKTNAPKLVNFASEVDDLTLQQAREIASMPFVHPHVALMPDAHYGKGSSVGAVIPTVDALIPAAVGVDLGCGMQAARTVYTAGDLADRPPLKELRAALEASIPMSAGNYNRGTGRFEFTERRIAMLESEAEDKGVDLQHSPKWRDQLGTLGGGNHFIELCLDEADRVWMFLHSGSRGVGNKIAQRHIKTAQNLCKRRLVDLPNPDLAYLPQGVAEFGEYLRDLSWAQRFAYENREEMLDRFRLALARYMGGDAAVAVEIEVERVGCHHNYTKREHHGGQDVWLTRKGAIDAHEGVMGLIPGSMGTRSYVVRGKGSAAGLCSAPHGAGRRYSRTKARQLFTVDDLAARMAGIEYRHGEAWVDEIPDAYKPVEQVIADAASLIEVCHELRQILNCKGT